MYTHADLKHYVSHEHLTEISAISTENLPKIHFKSPKVALILSILVGMFAIDRLYQGGVKMFLIKLAMLALTFGTWYIADIYFCRNAVQTENYNKLMNAVNG